MWFAKISATQKRQHKSKDCAKANKRTKLLKQTKKNEICKVNILCSLLNGVAENPTK